MVKKSESKVRIVVYIFLVVILNIVVAMLSIGFYKSYSNQSEVRRLNDKIATGEIENEEDISGMLFDYEIKIRMKDGETKDFSGAETYYWDGKEFFPASEFMKGYE